MSNKNNGPAEKSAEVLAAEQLATEQKAADELKAEEEKAAAELAKTSVYVTRMGQIAKIPGSELKAYLDVGFEVVED